MIIVAAMITTSTATMLLALLLGVYLYIALPIKRGILLSTIFVLGTEMRNLNRNRKKKSIAVPPIVGVMLLISIFVTSIAIQSAYADNGNGWPKTVKYKPRSEEGQTGLTIAQCDSPQQCKEVNGTPSPNLAAKKQCEDFSSEKCKKVKQ